MLPHGQCLPKIPIEHMQSMETPSPLLWNSADLLTNVSLTINQRSMEFNLTWDILNATGNTVQYLVNCSTEADGDFSISLNATTLTLTENLPSGSLPGATFNCCVLPGEMESQAVCSNSVIPTGRINKNSPWSNREILNCCLLWPYYVCDSYHIRLKW